MILPGGPSFVHQCSVRVKPSTHVRMYSCLPLPPLPPQPDSSVTLSCKRREGPQASGSTTPALPGAKVSTVAVRGRQSPEHGRGRGQPASARSSGLPFDRSFAFCCFHESWTRPQGCQLTRPAAAPGVGNGERLPGDADLQPERRSPALQQTLFTATVTHLWVKCLLSTCYRPSQAQVQESTETKK